MTKRIACGPVALLVVLAAASSAGDAAGRLTAAAAGIVETALAAHGGRAAVEGFRTFMNRSDVRHGAAGTPLQITLYFQKPGRFRLEQRTADGLQVIVFDGTRCWMQRGGETVETPELVSSIRSGLTRGLDMITRYDRPGVVLSDLGDAQSDGQAVRRVRWVENGEETILSFATASGLWIRSEYVLRTPNGEARYDYHYQDHRLVDGIRTPHHTTCFIDGQKAYEYVALQYRYDVPLDPELFVRPAPARTHDPARHH